MPRRCLASIKTVPGAQGSVYFSVRVEGGRYYDHASGSFADSPVAPLGPAIRASPWDAAWDMAIDLPDDLPPCVLVISPYLIPPGKESWISNPAAITPGYAMGWDYYDWPTWAMLVGGWEPAGSAPGPSPLPPIPTLCRATTLAGKPCSRAAGPNGFCYQHGPA